MPSPSPRGPFLPLLLRPVLLVAGLLPTTSGCGQSAPPAARTSKTTAPAPTTTDAGRTVADGADGAVTAAPLEVPPLPDGSPEQLLEFVAGLRSPQGKPASREELVTYVKGVCARGIEAADRIVARVPADDPAVIKAGRLKLESLMMLADVDEDEKAAAAVAAYAQSLADGPTPELARLGKRTLITTAGRTAFGSKNFGAIPGLVREVAALLVADPDDVETVQLADILASSASQIEIPDQPSPAIEAYETFAPLLAKSAAPQIRKLAERMTATTRRIKLPGTPMELEGKRLDGSAFDPKTLAGKVVLVDFWATWCGPCLEEIPNILAQYDRYHDKGFEVLAISLDETREELDAFLAEKKLPWPILFSGAGFDDPVARRYGVNGIPQLILIGRDGNVLSIAARGPRLAELLAEQFKTAEADGNAGTKPGTKPGSDEAVSVTGAGTP